MESVAVAITFVRDVLVTSSTATAGSLGALAGAAAAIPGVHVNGTMEAKRTERRRRISSVQASRAWTDDIYETQTSLASAYENDCQPDFDRVLRSRMGTTDGFLELAGDVDERDLWVVARGRRDLIEVLEVRQNADHWKRKTLYHFFWRLEDARRVIARIDEAWPAKDHRKSHIMGTPPGREDSGSEHRVER